MTVENKTFLKLKSLKQECVGLFIKTNFNRFKSMKSGLGVFLELSKLHWKEEIALASTVSS